MEMICKNIIFIDIDYKARKFNIDTYWPQNDKLVFRMKFSSAPACIFLLS